VIHSRSTQDPIKIHPRSTRYLRSTRDPPKIHSRSTQDPPKIHARSTQEPLEMHTRSIQNPRITEAIRYRSHPDLHVKECVRFPTQCYDPIKMHARYVLFASNGFKGPHTCATSCRRHPRPGLWATLSPQAESGRRPPATAATIELSTAHFSS